MVLLEDKIENKLDMKDWARINRDKIGKGIQKPRFRKPKKWVVQNRILLAVMMIEDIKLSELAAEMEVSSRTVAAWIYQGVKPTEEYRAFLAVKLGLPQWILFYDDQMYDKVEPITDKKFNKGVLSGTKINRILTGMFAVHNLSPSEFSRIKGIAPATTRKYMHIGTYPDAQYRAIYCSYFGLPEEILFYECL